MDWSYVSGFFDRSGNINEIKVKGHKYIQLRFYSNHKGILEEIQRFTGRGRIYVKKLSKKNVKWRDRFELTVTATKDIFIVLCEMLPFLVVKQDKVYGILTNHPLFKELSSGHKEGIAEDTGEIGEEEEGEEGEDIDIDNIIGMEAMGEEEKKEDVPYIG